MDYLKGQTIKGYRIGERIGSGGFGVIYQAIDTNVLKRPVAIKAILKKYVNDPRFIRRFESEAQIIASLEHPHIIPLYDYWREPNNAFIVLRWMSGGTLRYLIDNGSIPLDEVTHIVEQLLPALSFAHKNRIIHRDINPNNILFDGENNAILSDFGISTSIDTSESETNGKVMGAVNYLAPEQTALGQMTEATDLFAFGIVLFEMLTGRHPFDQKLLVQVRREIPSLQQFNPDLPDGLDQVLQIATAKEPAKRYQSALELLQAYHTAVLGNQRPNPAVKLATRTLANPYKGIEAFQQGDAARFYGRDSLIRRLIAQLSKEEPEGRFLAVVGASGSGKSSVVKAGLIPKLRQGILPQSSNWFFIKMMPGHRPFVELETALLRLAATPMPNLLDLLQGDEFGLMQAVKQILPEDEAVELVLIIDQFEELFTLNTDEANRALFLNSLVVALREPDSRLRVIITMRADFYDRLLPYMAFSDLLRRCTEYVGPLTEAELIDAIVQPAQELGVSFDDSLVSLIIQELGSGAGKLPLLQYALKVLFDERKTDLITHDDYMKIGGVIGALAQRAEDVYQGLDDHQQQIAYQIFTRLVTPREGNKDTRRRVRLDDLISLDPNEAPQVVEAFSNKDTRLLTTDRDELTRAPTIEVTHEALIQSWDRLQSWLNEEREGLLLQHRLSTMAVEWEEANQEPGLLATGLRLANFEDWVKSASRDLSEIEGNYLAASVAAEADQRRLDSERKVREEKTAKRAQTFRQASIILGIVALLAFFITIAAIRTSTRTSNEVVAAQSTSTRVAWESQVFALEVDRVSTLVAGDVRVDIHDIVTTPEAFLATTTAVAILSEWQPQEKLFNGVPMMLVPEGCFWIGNSSYDSQMPSSQICFEEPYWIDKYEVTNEQFETFQSEAILPAVWTDPQQPRTMVNWFEARDHCLQRGAQLPTEAQWEYAGRGVNSIVYPWGNQFNEAYLASRIITEMPFVVGSFPDGVSWVGAYEMSGNVMEWTHTLRSRLMANDERFIFEYPYTAMDERENATDDDVESFFILRGGGYSSSLPNLRLSARNWSHATEGAKEEHGFRCVRPYP